MQRSTSFLSILIALPLAGCGDDGTNLTASASASDSNPAPGTEGTDTQAPTSSASASASASASEGTGSATASGTTSAPTTTDAVTTTDSGTTTDPGTTTGPGTTTTGPSTTTTTDPGTTGTTTGDTESTTMMVSDSDTGSSSTTGGPPEPVCGNGVVEAGEECDDGDQIDKNACSNSCQFVPCDEQEGGGMGDFEYSYIWIANSPQGTVSKVDTATMVEVARYRTDADANSSPSRTAVNVDGRFAAVANRRSGSVTVFASHLLDCVDTNGNGMIDTSTGAGDVKPWGQDECMLWNLPINPSNNNVEQRGPRPLGWDFDDQDPFTCKYLTHTLWMGWYGNQNQGYFWNIDQDGTVLGEVIVPVWGNNSWGPYGGAVDRNHNFWVAGWHGPLVRVNADYTYDMWNSPLLSQISSYGMALDKEGDPWFGGCNGTIATFNAQTETFKSIGSVPGCFRGLMVDGQNRGWMAHNGGACLVQIDTVNDTIVNPNIPLPGCSTVVGVSIDVEGFVWVVDQGGSRAYKVDPDTLQSQTVTGFSSPYTYSDMTGAGIRLQALPQ